eukprot:6830498-Pyramimonas_sp.AAC.2
MGKLPKSADRDNAKEPRWSCKATRQCGFTRNFACNKRCYMCGRDQNGLPDPNGPPERGSRERAPSTPRRRKVAEGDAKDPDEVGQARKALASLRRCGLPDEHDLVVRARVALTTAEAAERARRTPDDMLRSALDRQSAKGREVEQLKESMDTLKEQYDAKVEEHRVA